MNYFKSLKPIYKESYSDKGKKKMFDKLRKKFGISEEKLKKKIRRTTGDESDPYERPDGKEVKMSQEERMRKMTEEANVAQQKLNKDKDYKKKKKSIYDLLN